MIASDNVDLRARTYKLTTDFLKNLAQKPHPPSSFGLESTTITLNLIPFL